MKSKGSKSQLKNVAGKERTQVKAGTSCVAKKSSPTKKNKLNGIGSSVKLDYEGSNKMQSNKCVKTVSCADSVIKNEDNVNKHHLKKRIKRLEWKQKQKDKKLKRIEKKSDVKKVIQNVTVTQRALPKTADEVSSNWKKMKEVNVCIMINKAVIVGQIAKRILTYVHVLSINDFHLSVCSSSNFVSSSINF